MAEKSDKINYIKEYKDLYMPKSAPVLVQVPSIPFVYVDGKGDPTGADYQEAMGVLYAILWTIKMSKMGGGTPPGYHDYVVPPLEGLWDTGTIGYSDERDKWVWTSMIRLPDFVTEEVFGWAVAAAAAKKPGPNYARAHYAHWQEGLCVQALHLGPYATEPETLEKMTKYMAENKLESDFEPATTGLARRHHEIYLGDPRRIAPEKRKTVLRHPVKHI